MYGRWGYTIGRLCRIGENSQFLKRHAFISIPSSMTDVKGRSFPGQSSGGITSPHLLTVVFAVLVSLSKISIAYQPATRGADAELGTFVSYGDEREVHSQSTGQT